MRYAVKGEAILRDGFIGLPVGATVDAGNSKEAKKKALMKFKEVWSNLGYVIRIDLVHLKNGVAK